MQSRVFRLRIFLPFSMLSPKITMMLLISCGLSLSLSEWWQYVVILFLLLSFLWLFILLFTWFVNSNSARFCSMRSCSTSTEVVDVSVELYGGSFNFWNLRWSSSISNNSPTTSSFPSLHTFVSCSLFLVYRTYSKKSGYACNITKKWRENQGKGHNYRFLHLIFRI